ncbi:uncharacterized protein UPF0233 [Salana multivorans]|uniref:Cell division protein CrgA n=1 Tax=Salana multivorans TaxID=120377 RepID=A0A3N2DA83_9MICO|nr:cell division protein CrgA [Salana multivorans]MBN8883720.1 cell division protein CrgA [Salana multivorans]OJX96872.1 MAG: hypothetical protein BGO96_01960 [Micrococcales bacterium 73-15]ROR96687.1 uncharacterized protein UPF0233 [Salana multivorans]
MPESRGRKKARPTTARPAVRVEDKPNPSWYVPTFVTLLVVGLVWVVVTYISDSRFPIPGIQQWNLAIGFASIFAGFIMTMRWR